MKVTTVVTSLLFTALLAAIPATASPVTVQFLGTSGVSDGSEYVLPYFLSINGGPSIDADCYDFFDTVTPGETWSANELTLAQAVATGQFSSAPNALLGYELVGVLDAFSAATPQNQIDLQHTIWDVFDPGAFTINAAMNLDFIEAFGEVPTFDFSNTRYIEGLTSSSSSGNQLTTADAQAPVQAFAIQVGTSRVSDSPEPGTLAMIGLGLAGILAGKVRRRA